MKGNTQICFVYCSPVKEGSARFATLPVKRLAQVCMEKSLSFHVVYSGELDTELLQDADVTSHRVSPPRSDNPLLKALWLLRTTRKVVRNHDIDILTNVWAHYEMAPVALGSGQAAVALRIVGDPISETATTTGLAALRRQVGRRLEQISVHMSDAVYFNSHTLKERFGSRLTLPSTAPVISQGVDTDQFAPKETNEPAPEEPIFLFAGRLDSQQKGVGRTVKAFARFRDRNGEGQLILAGRGDLPLDIQMTVETLDSVHIVGHLPHKELAAWYRDATALVLLSESEALPNVVLEAMASGLPVIATPVGDIPMLLDGDRGCLVMADGIDPVVLEMERLAEDPMRQSELASNARSYVERKHSFDVVGKAFGRFFKKIVN